MVLPSALRRTATDAAIFLEYGFPCSGFPWLEQAVLNDFMIAGGYDRLLKRLRRLYKARRDSLLSGIERAFGPQSLRGTDCGTHVIWRLSPDLPDAVTFQASARKCGVEVYTLDHASVASRSLLPDGDRILLLGFAATSETDIASSLALLGLSLGARKLPNPSR
jgi:GntR family transcriptional regulator / MocR family aminotransferase